MADKAPVFIADTCIGGLSVLKSLWRAGAASDAVFMADYAVNPLGTKNDAEIAEAVRRWTAFAERHADTLVIACNTLSIRYQQLCRSAVSDSSLHQVVSMVDCFELMVQAECDRLAGRSVLIIGTEFTASQDVYPELLRKAAPCVQISAFGATELERRIARFEPLDAGGRSVFDGGLHAAIADVDFAVLACTCFPMVSSRLANLFPGVTFLDPGSYCADLLQRSNDTGDRKLRIEVTGNVVEQARVTKFAQTYLGTGTDIFS
jgi:glutamate racemase